MKCIRLSNVLEQKRADQLIANTEGYLKGTFMKIYSQTQKRDLSSVALLMRNRTTMTMIAIVYSFSMCSGPVSMIRL